MKNLCTSPYKLCRTVSCRVGHLVSPYTLYAFWRWVASFGHWNNRKHPFSSPVLCLRGSRGPTAVVLYRERHRMVLPKVQCPADCSASLPGGPIYDLQYLSARLVLWPSTDHSPARTRSLDRSPSRTSDTTDSASFPSNPCPYLTSRFQCHQMLSQDQKLLFLSLQHYSWPSQVAESWKPVLSLPVVLSHMPRFQLTAPPR